MRASRSTTKYQLTTTHWMEYILYGLIELSVWLGNNAWHRHHGVCMYDEPRQIGIVESKSNWPRGERQRERREKGTVAAVHNRLGMEREQRESKRMQVIHDHSDAFCVKLYCMHADSGMRARTSETTPHRTHFTLFSYRVPFHSGCDVLRSTNGCLLVGTLAWYIPLFSVCYMPLIYFSL